MIADHRQIVDLFKVNGHGRLDMERSCVCYQNEVTAKSGVMAFLLLHMSKEDY